MKRLLVIGLAVVAGFGGAFGLVRIGTSVQPSGPASDRAQVDGVEPSAMVVTTERTVNGVEIETLQIDFRDSTGFRTYVNRLVLAGIDADFARWIGLTGLAERDPKAAFDLAVREELVPVWASGAALVDLEALASYLASLPESSARMALYQLGRSLGRRHPRRGAELMHQQNPADSDKVAFGLFDEWAQTSLDVALAFIDQLPDGAFRNRALAGVFNAWNVTQPRAVLAWATARGPDVARAAFRSFHEVTGIREVRAKVALARDYPETVDWMMIATLAGSLANEGAAGWETISALPEGPMRNQFIMRFGANLAREDPERAWEIAKALGPRERTYLLQLGAGDLAKIAPREMADLAARGELATSYGLRSVVESWAEIDPSAAYAWSLAHSRNGGGAEALATAVGKWSAVDAPAAALALDNLVPGIRAQVLPAAVEAWGEVDPAAAFRWASNLPPIERTRAVAASLEGWSRNDPAAAAEAALTMSSDGLDSAVDDIAYAYGQLAPEAAVAWAAKLDTEAARTAATAAAVQTWAQRDAPAASEYLGELERGVVRDQAVASFVNSVAQLDPASAAAWAKTIDKPMLQRGRIRWALESWIKSDRPAAQEFVGQMEPGEFRNKMTRLVQ